MHPNLYNKLLANKYTLRQKMKTGGFSSVYLAKGLKGDPVDYAIKIMPKKYKKYAEIEFELYQKFQQHQYTHGFAKQYQHGKFQSDYYLVMELLHTDLEQLLHKSNNNKFSIKTALMIALQIIDRIQALHKIGYLHRDIKPDNIAVGKKQNNKTLYLIDFGLAKKVNTPIPDQQKNKMIGTLGYMSIGCHLTKKLTILDDMQSFIYTLIYLIKGELPWMHINIKNQSDYHRVQIMKEKLSENWFKASKIPMQIHKILQYIRGCKDQRQFDYLKCKYKLLEALSQREQQNDYQFDWCIETKDSNKNMSNNKKEQKLKKQQKLFKEQQKQRRAQQYRMHLLQKKNHRTQSVNNNNTKYKQQHHKIKQNKNMVDGEVFAIYKFLQKQDNGDKEDKEGQNLKRNNYNNMQANKNNRNSIMDKQIKKQQEKKKVRPMSNNNKQRNNMQMSKQVSKQMKLIQAMNINSTGPNITVNHYKL